MECFKLSHLLRRVVKVDMLEKGQLAHLPPDCSSSVLDWSINRHLQGGKRERESVLMQMMLGYIIA